MRVHIYQINHARDSNRVKFFGMEELQHLTGSNTVDPMIYDEVFNAEVDEMGLEELYAMFNRDERHPLFRGHSMSVSDIVCMNGKAYFCDSFGFQEIQFDEAQTQKPENLMRILYVEPHRPAYEAEILNTLEAEQRAVKGLIEPIYMNDGVILVGNEESKLIGMEGNRYIPETSGILAGPFFVCGDGGEYFRSLTDDEASRYMKIFEIPDDITPEEVEEDTGFVFFFGQ